MLGEEYTLEYLPLFDWRSSIAEIEPISKPNTAESICQYWGMGLAILGMSRRLWVKVGGGMGERSESLR